MDTRTTAFSDSTTNSVSNGTTTSSTCLSLSTTTTPPPLARAEAAALTRLSDTLDSLLSPTPLFSDLTLTLPSPSSRDIPVHRCILAARSPFFRTLLTTCSTPKLSREGKVKVELKEHVKEVEVGYDAVLAVVGYLYSGKVRPGPKQVCVCVDDECCHVSCRPAVGFWVEVLYLSHVFQITELVALYQRHLLEILDKVIADDILVVLSVANMCGSACERLLARCIDITVRSDIDVTTLDRTLPQDIVKQIVDTRKEAGLFGCELVESPDLHVKRIHRALESDDVELVSMLLKEGRTNLDEAYALHHAVAHCDAKTTMELLELGVADVNLRNQRGYSVLHVAAMRKEPKIIVSLLTKGAQPTEVTSDGRKAIQIAKRLTKAADFYRSTEEGKAAPKDRLCIEILEQAERREPLLGEGCLSLAKAGEDLRAKLLYLENRVALARLLFPEEAKVAMDIAQVDGTSEFTLSKNIAGAQRISVDLNEAPFVLKEEHQLRMKALSRTVELGKHFFPRCSDVLNKIMDAEDLTQLAFIGNDTPEERSRKKLRYHELQEALTKAFTEDKVEFDRSSLSSSSSSTPLGKSHAKMSNRR